MQLNEDGVQRIGDLEIDEHLPFQHRSWRVQKFGRFVVVLFVLAGIAGLFGGGGPFAKKHVHSGPVQLIHPRFLRTQAPAAFEIRVERLPAGSNPLVVSLGGSFVRDFQIAGISPEPRTQSLGNETLVYEFARTDAHPPPIVFWIEPASAGPKSFSLAVLDQPPIQVDSFVFP